MVNSVESKLGVINSILDNSKLLLGEFKGFKISVENSTQYFGEINEKVTSLKQQMKENYDSINGELEKKSITGSPDEIKELSEKLENLKQKITRMDSVLTKAENCKAKYHTFAETVKAHAQELRGIWKQEKKMQDQLMKLLNKKEELTSQGFSGKKKSSKSERSPLVKNTLTQLREDIATHRSEINRVLSREEEIENSDEKMTLDLHKEITGFKKMLEE